MSDAQRPDGLPPLRPRHPHDFDAIYQGTPPWDIGRPQAAFVELANAGVLRGHVLDVGCGTGEHALMAAELGLEAVGIDTASTAIAAAERKAAERELNVRFIVANALELESLNELFDTVLDCGLFHIFEDDDRPRFVKSLRGAIRPGGHYYMLCFSDRQPGDWGPRRISQQEIESSFSYGWKIDSIEPARSRSTSTPRAPLRGWPSSRESEPQGRPAKTLPDRPDWYCRVPGAPGEPGPGRMIPVGIADFVPVADRPLGSDSVRANDTYRSVVVATCALAFPKRRTWIRGHHGV